jgi:hypothetical protein
MWPPTPPLSLFSFDDFETTRDYSKPRNIYVTVENYQYHIGKQIYIKLIKKHTGWHRKKFMIECAADIKSQSEKSPFFSTYKHIIYVKQTFFPCKRKRIITMIISKNRLAFSHCHERLEGLGLA